ncbi:L-2,4-diaminobutyric acid acetyltransferase [Streptomyces sp. enrichment culture]|uniref:diaminobutyrate acetyltransferase n=1 Tax=Streptomyces sp. enrichment culture TaxID=1795815 RepID=UPI003F554A33
MGTLVMTAPTVENGSAAWRIARDSGVLDVNSPYSYLLWFREFARTSAVALRSGGNPVGFVTGFHRPEQPDTLVVWQIAVDREQREHGIASAMLDHLAVRLAAVGALRYLETTISPDNTASDRLFRSFAERHAAPLGRDMLFPSELFPEAHEDEFLYRIGPLCRQSA